ncbi:MAG: hypothetical protein DMG64_10515 [Acidobacteria bacterium]|nr:MAG: hypothetical protein DMG64_10515 [Acidobacteriota bacterium]
MGRRGISEPRVSAQKSRVNSVQGSRKLHAKKRVRVTVSIGAASCDGDERPADAVLQAADKALYRAKNNGRNCTVVSA